MHIEFQISKGGGNSGIGNLLGWLMAAVYLGGRLPQIILNVRFLSAIRPVIMYSYFPIDDSFFLDTNIERLQGYNLEWPTINYSNLHPLTFLKKFLCLFILCYRPALCSFFSNNQFWYTFVVEVYLTMVWIHFCRSEGAKLR